MYTGSDSAPDFMLRSGVAYRLIKDHIGSVRLVVNAQSGAVAQQLDYDEFGRVLGDTNPGFQPFGLAGGPSVGTRSSCASDTLLDAAR